MSYTFLLASNFTGLTQLDYDNAYEDITTMFYGVSSLWSILQADIRQKKIDLCYQYLTAWYLADMNPSSVVGIQANGGMPISSKSVGGVSITYNTFDVQDGMKQLTSNVFGIKALQMLNSAPERAGIYS